MVKCKGISTPADSREKLPSNGSSLFSDPTLYRSIVGGFQYISLTRPEVYFFVHKASQFLQAPTKDNWSSVKRILRYLKGIMSFGLLIQKLHRTKLNVYTDAD